MQIRQYSYYSSITVTVIAISNPHSCNSYVDIVVVVELIHWQNANKCTQAVLLGYLIGITHMQLYRAMCHNS